MFYRIERTFVPRPDEKSVRDTKPYLVPAANARAAAIAFITHERACILGVPSDLPGDKASATASLDGRLFVIFVERAAEAIVSPPRRSAKEEVRP